ncbi:hypothetical protein H0H93_009985 [Arthromyces matolae]|nr:hypothetical protein H0H93_009985 [Arthromyces matolae]
MAGRNREKYLLSIARARERARREGNDPDDVEDALNWTKMKEALYKKRIRDGTAPRRPKHLIGADRLRAIAVWEAGMKRDKALWAIHTKAVERIKQKAIEENEDVDQAVARFNSFRLYRHQERQRKKEEKKEKEEANVDHCDPELVTTPSAPEPHPQDEDQHKGKMDICFTWDSGTDSE